MSSAVQLQLYAGPGIARPVPRAVIDALESVTVEANSGSTQSGFELTFEVSNRSPLHTLFLLAGGSMPPILRVVIAVTMRGATTVLMDGIVTEHETTYAGPGTSTLSVKGKDLTAVMDVLELNGLPYPAMVPAVRVLAALAKYAALGVTPMVIPSVFQDLPLPIRRVPKQHDTDYAFIGALADGCGYVFYIEPGPAPGVSRAYWGPQIRIGKPQKSLDAGLPEPYANTTNLQFSFDKEKKEIPVAFIQEPASKQSIPIPVPDVTRLGPPLGLIPPLRRIRLLHDTAKLSPTAAMMAGLAHAAQTNDAVKGSGSLDVARYGAILRARKLVGVRGVGAAFDGLHYVTKVTSTLRRGEFTQSFELARNGLISTLPALPR